MSSDGPSIEVAQEALEVKLDKLNIDDQNVEKPVESVKETSPKRLKNRQHRMFDDERRKQWEESQSKKPVLETGVSGTVKWYSVLGHYGFISRDDEGKDVFVHQSAISKSKIEKYFLRTLGDDECVLFDLVEGEKGPEAANVTGPDGAEVIGSKYFRIQLFRFRKNIQKKDKHDEQKEQPSDEPTEVSTKTVRPKVRRYRKREFRRKHHSKGDSDRKEPTGGRRRQVTDDVEDEKTAIENLSAGDAGLGAQSVERQPQLTN